MKKTLFGGGKMNSEVSINPDDPIILLDLNYTLVGNSSEIRYIRPYQKKR